ncbi:sulfite reductase subunit alpha [Roseomonas sp. AR75]|uniref:sulfite reductase subunit alpha n=1 Tax=Roseomonas sp. AR75 TaxID=2562311 RepID=UPI00197F1E35|nr:sulfite reductase subunit alpha [Roseomonas sp. AR75]
MAAAAAVLLGYAAFCGAIAWRGARRRPPAATRDEGAPLLVVHASQTGFAEELAQRTAAALGAAAVPVRLGALDTLDAGTLAATRRALFLVSTSGEGDAPDSAARFVRKVMRAEARLHGLEYGLLALGDRSYAHFCGFGRALDAWLRARGARPLFPRIEMDDGSEDALQRWQREIAALAEGAAEFRVAEQDTAAPWRLVEREALNPEGLGAPVFRLAFEPVRHAAHWHAGDIAVLEIHGAGDGLQRRDYSIASIPEDGRIDLLVRQVRRADGTLGRGSGLLTAQLQLGDQVALRLRANRGFRAPEEDRPMVLIGNGTGMAGLRAHLRARQRAGRRRNWLLFGERSRAQDFLCGAEIEAMLADGHLARLDLAVSREAPRRHVQDALRAAGDELRAWVAEGAVIMVCGSLEGMAPGVHAALQDILGAEALEALAAAGRYRRDVY